MQQDTAHPDNSGAADAGQTPPASPAGGPAEDRSSTLGLIAACLAFIAWGILPVFWKALQSVDAFEVLCHRIVWSFAMLVPFMFAQGRLGSLLEFLKSRRNLLGLVCSGYILAGNWYLYIWAITSDMVVEASLGYFITPLVNVLFGVFIFREKANPIIWISIGIATAGVLYQVLALGHLPLVPLGLALSFALYGLLRKVLLVQALSGLFVETLVVMPIAAGYLIWQASLGNSAMFRGDFAIDALLIGAGIITTFPLVMFAYGARRIRMTTLGLLQYSTPSWVFLLGVFVYNEPFSVDRLITFVCIWTALALYTWQAVRQRQW